MGPIWQAQLGESLIGYAHQPQLGSQIHWPIGNQIWGPLGKEDVCLNFVCLTVGKFVFSNSGNFRAKANPPKPRSCPKRPFGQWLGPNSSADWDASAAQMQWYNGVAEHCGEELFQGPYVGASAEFEPATLRTEASSTCTGWCINASW